MARKLEIICDMDAILVDLFAPWLGWYNETYGDDLCLERITGWDIHGFVKTSAERRSWTSFTPRRSTRSRRCCTGTSRRSMGRSRLRELYEDGHDLIICSAVWVRRPARSTSGAPSICRYAPPQHLPGTQKYRLTGDVFIDDGPHNVVAHRKKWGQAVQILSIAYPYNKDIHADSDLCADGHLDTRGPGRRWLPTSGLSLSRRTPMVIHSSSASVQDHRGETRTGRSVPHAILFGSTRWHRRSSGSCTATTRSREPSGPPP